MCLLFLMMVAHNKSQAPIELLISLDLFLGSRICHGIMTFFKYFKMLYGNDMFVCEKIDCLKMALTIWVPNMLPYMTLIKSILLLQFPIHFIQITYIRTYRSQLNLFIHI